MKYTVEDTIYGCSWFKYKTDIYHREDNLPCMTSLYSEHFAQNGDYHRTNGPAYIIYQSIYSSPKRGEEIMREYYLRGRIINVKTDEEFFQYQKLQAFI